MEDEAYCSECQKSTVVVFDHNAGDSICTECGLVLEDHAVDETCEWRSFADEEVGNDPNRVGAPANPLLSDEGFLSTFISKSKSKDSATAATADIQDFKGSKKDSTTTGNHRNRFLESGFRTISEMCERLDVVTTIKDRACEIFKNGHDQNPVRGKKKQDAVSAACLYLACRELNPRPVKEICSAIIGVTQKELVRTANHIVKHVKVEMRAVSAGDFTRRFCHRLGMPSRDIRAAQELVAKAELLDIRRAPLSVAAAAIYMVSLLSSSSSSGAQNDKGKLLLKDISTATGVAEATIRKSYKDAYPYSSRLIPNWFAREHDLNNLTAP